MAKVISITSGKGGVGKSSVAIGLATAFAFRKKRVLIIELDIGLRCIDLMLGVENEVVYDLGDIVCNRCSLYDAIIHAGDIHYIAAPPNISTQFSFKKVVDLINALKNDYDYIVIDTPAGLGISILSIRDLADMALIVTTPDAVCIRDAAKVALMAEESGFTNYRLIINRVSKAGMKKAGISDIDEIIDNAGAQLIGVIPDDMSYRIALSKGKKIDEKSIIADVFDAISRRIDSDYVPLITDKL